MTDKINFTFDPNKRPPKFWINKKVYLTKEERYLMVRLLRREILRTMENANLYFDDSVDEKRKEVMLAFDVLKKISQSRNLHHRRMTGQKFTKEEQEEYNVDEDGNLIMPGLEELNELE